MKEELIKKKYVSTSKNILLIKNKCDDIKQSLVYNKKNSVYCISAKNSLGINQLLTQLCTLINSRFDKKSYQNVMLCNVRQIKLLKEGNQVISEVTNNLEAGLEMDIIAAQLKDFVYLMDEMLGRVTSNEVLNNIFKGFCVGK